jgi:hypothetical protein
MVLMGGLFAHEIRSAVSATSTNRIARRSVHFASIAILFVGAGLFAVIAERTGIPFSVAILICWLTSLARESNAMHLLSAADSTDGIAKTVWENAAMRSGLSCGNLARRVDHATRT